MKNLNKSYLLLIPIVLALILATFGGGMESVQVAESGAGCYYVYLPAVLGSGSGGAAPTTANFCDEPPVGTGAEVEADFNGDGYADLAIGSPEESVPFGGDIEEAGAVHVLYGTASGLSADDSQLWTRADADLYRDPEPFDHFGAALTVGDFDDDGYSDLAIGVPNSTVWPPEIIEPGVVQVLYGSAAGLTADGDQLWAQSITNIPGDPEDYDHFGAALTTGDYNFDGYSDLAIGVPGETVNGIDDAGAVNVIYGSATGLDWGTPIPHLVHQNLGGSADPEEPNDYFGSAMTSGDFNSDGIDDLAVGVPDEDIPTPEGNLTDAGAVQIFYGQGFGLVDTFTNSADSDYWYADSNPFVEGALEAYDRFGHSVAAGDFNNDTYDDLAVGIPSETHGDGGGAILLAGAINVFHGSITGIDATAAWPARIWHQDSTGFPGDPQFAERFGFSLVAADFNDDGYADLAIGSPFEEYGSGDNVGAAYVLYGTAVGLSTAGVELHYQGLTYSELNDHFGQTLAADDFDGDGHADLAIGGPNDTPDVVPNTGSVTIREGRDDGLEDYILQQLFHQGTPCITGAPETGEGFGGALQ